MPTLHQLRVSFYHARRDFLETLKGRLTGRPSAPELVVGRKAAKSAVDQSREELLNALLYPVSDGSVERIAVLGSERTAALVADYPVVALHPGSCVTALVQRPCTALLIDERGFDEGNWSYAMTTAGESLYADIRAVIDEATHHKALIIGIRDTGAMGTHTAQLREAYDVSLPLESTDATTPVDGTTPLPVDPLALAIHTSLQSLPDERL